MVSLRPVRRGGRGSAWALTAGFEGVEVGQGVGLHGVAHPGAQVAGFVGPGDGLGDVEFAGGFGGHVGIGMFGGFDKLGGGGEKAVVIEEFLGKGAEKIEDAGGGGLMFAEGFVVHEEVAELAADLGDHGSEFFRGEREVGGARVGETEGDGIAEGVVAEEEGEGSVQSAVGEGGAAVVEEGLPAFGEDGGVAEVGGEGGDGVGVDEFGVAEGGGLDAEEALDHFGMEGDLFGEFRGGVEGGEAVVEGFGEEFDVAGLGEGVEALDDFGGVEFELLHGGAGDGESDAELAAVVVDEFEEDVVGGAIAAFGDAFDEAGVEGEIEVGGVGIKDGVLPEAEGLVDLEVEADGWHRAGL